MSSRQHLFLSKPGNEPKQEEDLFSKGMTTSFQMFRVLKRVFKTQHYGRSYTTKASIAEKDQYILSYEQILPMQFRPYDYGKKNISVDVNVRTIHRHDWEPRDPVILCLHGLPGDGGDFHGLSCELAKYGFQCVAPDFPGCGKSQLHPKDIYSIDYSPSGKEEMLNKILDKLKLERVDVLVSHSAGSFLGFRATAKMDRIKSGAFICFLGGKPHRYARPFNLLLFFAKLLKKPVFQPLLWFLPKFYEIIGFSKYDVQPLQIAVENVITAEYEKILDHAMSMKDQKKPALFAFATTDKILELDIPFTILNHIGINQSGIINLCRENNRKENIQEELMEKESEMNWYYKAIQFDRGGHLLQKTQIPEITRQIVQLIQQTRN